MIKINPKLEVCYMSGPVFITKEIKKVTFLTSGCFVDLTTWSIIDPDSEVNS